MNILKNAKSVREASDAVLLDFERPANQSETVKANRAAYGQRFYNKYKAAFKPYTIKVIANELNVRKAPGLNNPVTTTLKKSGVSYTIVEEKQVVNSDKSVATWGKLKSGIGWINVGEKYVKKN